MAMRSVDCRWGRAVTRCWPPWPRSTAMLPDDQPRYFMGLGDPIGMVEVVALGVDMFDCVLPTRLARPRHLADRRAAASTSSEPSSPDPTIRSIPVPSGQPRCPVFRGYLRHLLSVDEPTAGRLLTLHNLAWVFDFVPACADPSWTAVSRLPAVCPRGVGRVVISAPPGLTWSGPQRRHRAARHFSRLIGSHVRGTHRAAATAGQSATGDPQFAGRGRCRFDERRDLRRHHRNVRRTTSTSRSPKASSSR
jgi:hypothetical protein